MPFKSQENGNGSRPQNGLLRSVSAKDFKSLGPHLDQVEVHSGQALYHPGDAVESVYFPCGQTVVALAVAVDDDRDIDTVLIGREGAVGGFVSRDRLPSYWRAAVKVGGPLILALVAETGGDGAPVASAPAIVRALYGLSPGADLPIDGMQCSAHDRATRGQVDHRSDRAHGHRTGPADP